MLAKLGDAPTLLNLPDETLAIVKTQAAKAETSLIVRATSLFNEALFDLKSSLLAVPQLPLELAFVEAVTPTAAPSIVSEAVSAPSATPAHKAETPIKQTTHVPVTPKIPNSVNVPVTSTPNTGLSTTESSLTPEYIMSCLERVIRDIEPRGRTMAEALRSDVRLKGVVGREIQFVTSEFMKGRFEKPQPKAVIDEAFSRALGQAVTVRFLAENTSVGSGGQQADTQSDTQQATTDASEVLIKLAIDELGGQIVE
jgi:hypothetical protein